MTSIRVLVGPKKGEFVLASDGKRSRQLPRFNEHSE